MIKKTSLGFMLLSCAVIIFFFIKEQFRGIVLSSAENMTLSITYLVFGLSMLIFGRINFLENKKEQ
ncbi:MAG TPA: hypothetical protein VN726_22070 [Hanamia sp.]|nr:hypothetical protein [Hanamia sp.]